MTNCGHMKRYIFHLFKNKLPKIIFIFLCNYAFLSLYHAVINMDSLKFDYLKKPFSDETLNDDYENTTGIKGYIGKLTNLEEEHKRRLLDLKKVCGKMNELNFKDLLAETVGDEIDDLNPDNSIKLNDNGLNLPKGVYFSIDDMKPADFRNFIYDDANKLIYCYVPKVACTNWKRVLLVLAGKGGPTPLDIRPDQTHSRTNYQFLSTLNMSEIQKRLSKYFTFVVVRHPLERLLSAFRDKFEMSYSEYFQKLFGRKIIKNYRAHPSKRSLEKGHDVTFEEFVSYLIDQYETLGVRGLNEHWKPAQDMCHPCAVNFDVVGKYETLERDANYVLQKARLYNKVHFPPMPKHHVGSRKTFHMIKRYLRRLSPAMLSYVRKIYSTDLMLFNYTFKDPSYFNLPLDLVK